MGTDKNLEIGDFGIYHLAGFSGVLSGLIDETELYL